VLVKVVETVAKAVCGAGEAPNVAVKARGVGNRKPKRPWLLSIVYAALLFQLLRRAEGQKIPV
jgi:hypothetical protein